MPQLRDYEQLLSSDLTAAPLAFVDVETTGLDPSRGDRMCEIAIIRREPSGSTYEWSQLVDPGRRISPGAFAVNRITASMLRGAPRFSSLIPEINDVVEGAVWVAHNATFDLGFLKSEYKRGRRVLVERPVIDTAHLARRHFRFRSNALGELALQFGIVAPNAHRALGDCRTTMGVFDAITQAVFGDRCPALHELALHPESLDRAANPWTMLPRSLGRLLSETREIDIAYVSGEGEWSTRRVTVIDVVKGQRDLYLVAHCHLRGDERHFRVDRILDWKTASTHGAQ
jgi:DNA polymerase-3 subunit epsilon